MLAYEDLQTPPPARTATVTDNISPLVTGPPGGPTGPRWDGGPAEGLIELEVSSLGGFGLCHHQWCTQRAGWAVT